MVLNIKPHVSGEPAEYLIRLTIRAIHWSGCGQAIYVRFFCFMFLFCVLRRVNIRLADWMGLGQSSAASVRRTLIDLFQIHILSDFCVVVSRDYHILSSKCPDRDLAKRGKQPGGVTVVCIYVISIYMQSL